MRRQDFPIAAATDMLSNIYELEVTGSKGFKLS